jgi:hypothetical protein
MVFCAVSNPSVWATLPRPTAALMQAPLQGLFARQLMEAHSENTDCAIRLKRGIGASVGGSMVKFRVARRQINANAKQSRCAASLPQDHGYRSACKTRRPDRSFDAKPGSAWAAQKPLRAPLRASPSTRPREPPAHHGPRSLRNADKGGLADKSRPVRVLQCWLRGSWTLQRTRSVRLHPRLQPACK